MEEMSFKIGKTSAAPGERVIGKIKVAELHDGAIVSIPYIIINGANPGPVLLVTSGHNGLCFNAIEAARRLSKIDPKNLSGTLVVIPIVNTPAFMVKRSSNIMEQSTVLFNSYPGKPDGTVSQRIAYAITNEFFAKVNYHVDLLNGGLGSRRPTVVVFYPCPDKLLKDLIELATAYGSPFMTDAHNKITPRLAARPATAAGSKGVLSIMAEEGEGSSLDENEIESQYKGVTNVMKHYNMLNGEPELPEGYTVWDMKSFPLSKYGGFVKAKVHAGERVSKGQKVAEITDEFYNLKEDIIADADGFITTVPTNLTVGCGERCGVQISINYCDTISAKKLYELSKNRPPTP